MQYFTAVENGVDDVEACKVQTPYRPDLQCWGNTRCILRVRYVCNMNAWWAIWALREALSSLLWPSARRQLTLQDRGYGASASRSVSLRWCSQCLTNRWPGWVDRGGWLHTGMVSRPKAVTHFGTCTTRPAFTVPGWRSSTLDGHEPSITAIGWCLDSSRVPQEEHERVSETGLFFRR